MSAIYNEIDPYPVEWLRSLSTAGHIASGAVDGRSIVELAPDDVRAATQFHAFAGIGVWSYALRLAGWPDETPVWTGSCPCQPFSSAGKKGGFDDARHLWPEWFRLIKECRPPVILGEQVASSDGLKWLDAVSADLEAAGYAFAASDLCAAGVGAPHRRQRLYFVAVADANCLPREQGRAVNGGGDQGSDADAWPGSRGRGGSGGVADDDDDRCEVVRGFVPEDADAQPRLDADGCGATRSFWGGAEWIPCRDGKHRPVEPGTFPLAHGAPARVGRLRAYGNAIVPQVAATFIRAVMEAM
jgi:DNA (cytosine-5)-methyltransferase 1